jgi:hypothetical protein
MTTPDVPLPEPGDTSWSDWAAEQEEISDAAREITAAEIVDWVEATQDAIGTNVEAGDNVAVEYLDATTGKTRIHATAITPPPNDYANAAPWTVFTTFKAGTIWTRPSTREDLVFIFRGADPAPNVVTPPATDGMYSVDMNVPTP